MRNSDASTQLSAIPSAVFFLLFDVYRQNIAETERGTVVIETYLYNNQEKRVDLHLIINYK